MGWTFLSKTECPTRDLLVQYLTGPRYWNFRGDRRYSAVKHATTTSGLWVLVRRETDDAPASHFITLFRIEREMGEWGYKGIDESMGPAYYDCPLALLNAADAKPEAYAAEWRVKVREWHETQKATRAAVKTLTPGTVLVYGGKTYRLERPSTTRGSWLVTATNGVTYRMNGTQIREALRAEHEVVA